MRADVWYSDAGELLESIEPGSVTLLWTDPPWGTGTTQAISGNSYPDTAKNAVELLERTAPLMVDALTEDGTLAVMLPPPICRMASALFASSLKPEGEIIVHSELGSVAKKWWSMKHAAILLFSKGKPKFNLAAVPTTDRLAPVTRNGVDYTKPKRVTSVWRHTMSNTDSERVGYPSQKPLAVVEPFVLVHTDPGDLCVDPFGGSGTLAVAACRNGRAFVTGDANPAAVLVIKKRLKQIPKEVTDA